MQELNLIRFAEFFINNPYNEFYIREIAKKLNISPFAAKKYSDILVKSGILKEERRANLRYIKPNMDNLFYKYLKISYNINNILKSGLIEFIKDNIPNLTSVILFGSLAKGEDDDKSDIDLVIIGKAKKVSLEEFEEKLKKEIRIHFFGWSDWNEKTKKDASFYYEVISYGIPLYGELPLSRWK
jgi:predicted nucleotidyltransferase